MSLTHTQSLLGLGVLTAETILVAHLAYLTHSPVVLQLHGLSLSLSLSLYNIIYIYPPPPHSVSSLSLSPTSISFSLSLSLSLSLTCPHQSTLYLPHPPPPPKQSLTHSLPLSHNMSHSLLTIAHTLSLFVLSCLGNYYRHFAGQLSTEESK